MPIQLPTCVAAAAVLAACATSPAQPICGEWNIPNPRPGGSIASLCRFQGVTYVGGNFTSTTGNYLTRWDGHTFVPLPQQLNSYVNCMTVFDDGSGPALYIGGNVWTLGVTNYVGGVPRSGPPPSGPRDSGGTPVEAPPPADDG